jgi:hypothetical protein
MMKKKGNVQFLPLNPGAIYDGKTTQNCSGETLFFYMKSPLLHHQSPDGERGALGYNDSD